MARDGSFHCELEKSKDVDENGNQVTTIKCHGDLVTDTAGEIKELVRPLIQQPRRSQLVQTRDERLIVFQVRGSNGRLSGQAIANPRRSAFRIS